MLIDTHCHLAHDEDIDKIINDAKENNVDYLVLGGCSKKENIENLNLVSKYNNIYATLGYHPDMCLEYDDSFLSLLENQIKNKKVLAIGEIGLDYHYGKENRNEQIKMFRDQLLLAQKYNLPVVIHSRDAVNDTINILKEYNVKGIIHCFSGSLEVALEYIKMGYLLGIGGVVTFKNSKLSLCLKNISLDNIVLETDSPYLSPIRGEKNSPKNILLVAEFLAKLYNVSLEQVAKKTTDNALLVFGISN